MIEKEIVFDGEGRERLKRGIDILAEAVSTTLGASGRTVIIEDEYGNPHITKDGVTVANSIILTDPIENLGCSILKQASQKTASEAGDGTTTSVVLAHAIINKCFANIDEIENVTQAKEGIETAAKEIVKLLEKGSKSVNQKTLLQVATISANGDPYIGKLVSNAYEEVGKDGIVNMEDSLSGIDHTEVTNGTRIKRGYGTPFSINNLRSKSVEYQNPLIVISDTKIDMHERLHFAFEQSIKQKKPLLIISELDDRVKLFVAQNINKKNLTCNFIHPEGVGISKFELLEDLCMMTGARMISELSGDSKDNIDASYLGTCASMVSNSNETVLIFDKEEINSKKDEVISYLKEEISKTSNRSIKYHLQDRLSKLSGGVAIIKLSGNSEVELKEKKDRVDDSIHATKAALEEGVVAGGGVALLDVYEKIAAEPHRSSSSSFKLGYKMMINSIPEVWEKIMSNSGQDLTEEEVDLMEGRKINQGFDVKNKRFGNMFTFGIVDPLKVTKNAVLNSASVASTILTTSCVISNKRKK
jgi:chaperonin GroEL|tara:strand:- start:2270 stop:3859 length:1590 start_codon:yes stop_codon:yes gene_type:complete